MKKSTLALSVAAAIGSFGFIGNAMAIGELTGAAANTVMRLNTDGIGHQLVVPYFSAQSGNATLLNIANTDTVNAKVVKVRFRGAANSDDLFDFTLLMSPGDVWTAAVSQDPTTGLSLLRTTDASCVLPAAVKASTGAVFITGRVDPTPAKGNSANETREGYVEIINMADIPPTKFNAGATAAAKALTLFGTVKHASAVAACDATVLGAALGTDYATNALATTGGVAGGVVGGENYSLAAPTGLLTSDWVILNQTTTAAWSGSATALQVVDAGGVNAAGNIAFWPQKDNLSNGAAPLLANTAGVLAQRLATTDPLFVTGAVTIQPFDLPDLSTPYTALDSAGAVINAAYVATMPAITRADDSSAKFAVKSITNQFVTNSGIAGVTDFLFSQPTRRYSVAVNYTAAGTTSSNATDIVGGAGTRAAAVYRAATAVNTQGDGSLYYGRLAVATSVANTTLTARQVCLTSIASPSFLDREETPGAAGGFVISPGVATSFSLCGEAAVASINAAGVTSGSALSATVVRNDITFGTGFDLGRANFTTLAAAGGNGLPILGASFVRVANGAVNYGFTMAHKVTR